MSATSLWTKKKSTYRRAGRRTRQQRPELYRPQVEVLENRCLLNAGALDETFGVGGLVRTDFGGGEAANAVAIYPAGSVHAGKIVAVGGMGSFDPSVPDFVLARYHPDGRLDTGFGGDGKVTTDFGFNWGLARDVAITADGKILVVGTVVVQDDPFSGENWNIALTRYGANGSLDTSFGTDGFVLTDLGGFERADALAIDDAGTPAEPADDQYVVAGTTFVDGKSVFALVRYNASGALVTSFGTDGRVTTTFGGAAAQAFDVAIQPNGKIIAVGGATDASNSSGFALARYDANGTLDPTLDGDGLILGPLGGSAKTVVLYPAATPAEDSQILVAVDVTTFPSLARYHPDGRLDTDFGGNGIVVRRFSNSSNDTVAGLALQSDGKIVMVGWSTTIDPEGVRPTAFAVARFTMDGGLDTDLATGFGEVTASMTSRTGTVITHFQMVRDPSTGDERLSHDEAHAVAIDAAGNIVVVGRSAVINELYEVETEDFAIARYVRGGVIFVEDGDSDGVPDAVEDAHPDNGDGNRDGIPDSRQDHVASLPNGVDGRHVTLESSAGSLRHVGILEPVGPSAKGVPFGVFSFTVEGIAPGSAVDVTLYLPTGLTIQSLYKRGPTPDDAAAHWYEFVLDPASGLGAEIIEDAGDADHFTDRIVLHLVDGGLGDDDLTPNGTIVDGLAPALPGPQGIFIEDFSWDIPVDDDGDFVTDRTVGDPNRPGFDTSLDGFFFRHHFNGANTHVIDTPLGGDHALLLSSAGILPTIDTITFPGLAADLLVTLAHVEVIGEGRITFIGRDDDYHVDIAPTPPPSPQIWRHISVTPEQVGDHDRAVGPIRAIVLQTFGSLWVDNVSALVLLNQPPTAVPDFAATLPGQPVDIDLLANDADPNNDPIVITGTTPPPPEEGTIAPVASGVIRYRSAPGFHGVAAFSYTISDGINSSVTGSVRVSVEPPVANDDHRTVLAGQSVPIAVLVNDTTPGNDDPLHIVRFSDGPANGTVTRDFDVLTYSPNPGFHGVDTFTYTIRDDFGNEDSATVTVTVSTRPAAVDHVFDVAGGFRIVSAPGLLAGATDPDGDTVSAVPGEFQTLFFGRVSVNEDGSFVYRQTSSSGGEASDVFTYRVRDAFGVESDIATVRLIGLNQAPVASGGTIVAAHGAPATEDAPLRGSFAYAKPDGDSVFAEKVEEPVHGDATLTVRDGQVEVEYVVGATGIAIGSDRFTYRLFDGLDYSDVVAVKIRVPNNPPIAIGDQLNIRFLTDGATIDDNFLSSGQEEEELMRGRVRGEVGRPFANDLHLTRLIGQIHSVPEYPPGYIDDFDPDGDQLRFTMVQPPQYGTMVRFNGNTGEFVYHVPSVPLFPQRELTGAALDLEWIRYGFDWFTYQTFDGHSSSEAMVFIHFIPERSDDHHLLDKAYEVSGRSIHLPEGLGVNHGAYLLNEARHGQVELHQNGSFTYRADPGFVGVDSFQYLVKIGGVVWPGQVSLIVRNNPPEATEDHFWAIAGRDLLIPAEHGLLVNDRDADGHTFQVDFIGQPSRGQILSSGADGGFVYRPNPGFVGADAFQYQVSDPHGLASWAAITIEVSNAALSGEIVNLATPAGDHVALVSAPGSSLHDVRVVDVQPPPGIELPFGLFHFEVHGLTPGQVTTVRLLLPPGAPEVSDYFKYGRTSAIPIPHWYELEGVRFRSREIVLTLRDGGLGDDDLTPNGVIVDPGAPAFRVAPPTVDNVVINGGQRQRSKVNRLTVTFSDVVTLDPGAFALIRQSGRRTWSVPLHVTTATFAGRTVATITFRKPATQHGSLRNGNYRFTIHGDRIHDVFSRALDGDGVPGGEAHTEFFRRFGDTDGDGDVDRVDLRRFWETLGSRRGRPKYLSYLDADGDGLIEPGDGWPLYRKLLRTEGWGHFRAATTTSPRPAR